MSKKLILVLASVIFFSSFRLAFASVIINEIMYSPASKQWVEVYNDTNSDIDLTQYKILDAGASKNGHNISAVSGGSNVLPAHTYGVIALDITSVSATYLFHAALGISTTTNDNVILKNGSNVVDTVTVTLNSATGGNSLQLIDGSWLAEAPTPGAINQISPVSSAATTSSVDSSGQSMGGPLVTDYIPPIPNATTTGSSATNSQIKIQITGNNYAFAGVPTTLKVEALQSNQAELNYGKYFLNFGDGDSKEVKMNGLSDTATFNHTYFYPGDYIVTAEYYNNSYSDIPDVTAKVVIDTVPNDITISKVGDDQDFFIELSNNTVYDADLSDWILSSGAKSFTLPQNTIIQAKKTLMLSSKITSFSVADENTLKLMTPQNELVFDYAASVAPVVAPALLTQDLATTKIVAENIPAVKLPEKKTSRLNLDVNNDIPATNLAASAISGDSASSPKNNSRTVIIFIVSFLFIGISGIRYKNEGLIFTKYH